MKKINFCDGWTVKSGGEEVSVTLPHDAMFSEARDGGNPSGKNGAYFAGGNYVYTKKFIPDEKWRGNRVYFVAESVYRNGKVLLNGKELAGRPYGYLPITADLTDELEYGKENELKVTAENSDQPNSRWYTGAGMYRPASIYVLPARHMLLHGVGIKTTDYKTRAFVIDVSANADGEVSAKIVYDGKTLWSGKAELSGGKGRLEGVATGAPLWSADSPSLCTLEIEFGEDRRQISFGFRQLFWSAKTGLLVNGERVILRGACIHHDNGPIGAAGHPFAEERKVRLMKEAGYNALRMAHNPCSEAIMAACDKLGMYILDEYVDMWYIHKDKYDYASYHADWWERDLADIVDKDRNSPSVIMYSIGNEVAETSEERGIKLTEDMTEYIHGLDDTRPVTCGVNIFFNLLYSMGMGQYSDKKAEKNAKKQAATAGKKKKKAVGSEFFNNLAGLLGARFMKFGATLRGSDKRTRDAFAKMDVAGYNYGIGRYKKDFVKYPDRIILGSETFCADAAEFMRAAEAHPALIGDFVWAGMDYMGEVGVGSWVYGDRTDDFSGGVGWLTAGSGRVDINGGMLGEAAYTRVAFGLDDVRVAVVPPVHAGKKHSPSAWKFTDARESWSYDGCEGVKTKAEVYARAARAEVYVNGKKAGAGRIKKNGRAVIRVKYLGGELTAVAYDESGKETGRSTLRSAGKETVLTARPEQAVIPSDGLAYIRLEYTDGAGTLKPLVRSRIKVTEVTGGELIALGHACPFNPDGFGGRETDTYFGEALAVVRPNGSGYIKLEAESAYGKAEATVKIV